MEETTISEGEKIRDASFAAIRSYDVTELVAFAPQVDGSLRIESSTAAVPCGTCWRCGGTVYEYLVHHCMTNVRLPR